MTTPPTYQGEPKERRVGAIYALALAAPGLGLLYVGEWGRAILANLLAVVMLEGFFILFASMKFFPLLPAVVILATWVVWVLFCARAARKRIPAGEYILKPVNHALIYGVFAVVTFWGPVAATIHFTLGHLIAFQAIADAGMVPTLRPGDYTLVDRTAYKKRLPTRGELLTLVDGEQWLTLRTVAVESDGIRFEGDVAFVNEEPLPRQAAQLGISDSDVVHVLESNLGVTYPLAFSPRVHNYGLTTLAQVPDDTVFALADNRSLVPADGGPAQPRDSRAFGPVAREKLVGKPLFVAWSVDPGTGSIRWDRIGLRLP